MTNVAAPLVKAELVNPPGATKPLVVCIHGGGCNARYFDLPGFSFRERAVARGFPLLLVNRPGHGGSDDAAASSFSAGAAAILKTVVDCLAERSRHDWFLIGHSIGGAIAIMIAGEQRVAGLRGVALSGIGDRPTEQARSWVGGTANPLSGVALAEEMLFGPRESYSWRAPKALRAAAEPWRPGEVIEALEHWPYRFAPIARKVGVPVHLRLADAEHIWETGAKAIARMAAAFEDAPAVDAAILPDGGHLYEVHRRGGEQMEAQLDFLDGLSRRLDFGAGVAIPRQV
ncbi:alpha/beta hydrolase [Sphingomonas sp. 8AM]|uniref:alpha/beta hydrolase n=1 Tax=Sphingomonas sp. 8AM TaxID=2653170 RepID=UPI0012EF34E9|nr:alpha/beta hydrolase [Sphingomonas sp. 8AM]VXD01055.1 conserved hypothetical protein [Sphingomonas sp. 8AM]